MFRFSQVVDKKPALILSIVLTTSLILFLISVLTNPLPSFNDPLLGFEVRGTQIAQRINSWKLLLENTSWAGKLTMFPSHDVHKSNSNESNSIKNKNDEEENIVKDIEESESKHFRSGNHFMSRNETFCGKLIEDYAHFIVESVDDRNLFTLESLQTLCKIDHNLLRLRGDKKEYLFNEVCEQKNLESCCPSWSLANYVALIANKSSCFDINEDDVNETKSLLISCASYYHKFQLNDECENNPHVCRNAPKHCFKYKNAVFYMMHYLIDYNFMNPASQHSDTVRYTSIFLPIAKSTKLLNYYIHISKSSLHLDQMNVAAMDLGLKHTLFDEFLLHDTIYLSFAFIVILLSLLFYTSSILVTLITVLTIASSLGTAYFFYTTIFKIRFFPFMNLMAVVIAIGMRFRYYLNNYLIF